MTDETENLVPELLRAIRANIGPFRSDMEKRSMAVETRPSAIDFRLEGWRSVFVATTGSLATDLKDQGTRLAALEGTST